MKINNICYSSKFKKELNKLEIKIVKIALEKEKLFKYNPLHSSLRLRELKGNLKNFWSISINMRYRIIFLREDNGDILFISIGKHDIYKNL